MRALPLTVSLLLCAACAKPAEEAAVQPDSTHGVRPMSIAAVAGHYRFRTFRGDDTLPNYELTVPADTSGWTMTFANRPPIPVRVSLFSADSIVTDAGPYESVVRPGVRVTVHAVYFAFSGSRLLGTATARYSVRTADSVVALRMSGTRLD